MNIKTGYDVVQPIAVRVEHRHHAAAEDVASVPRECFRMIGPRLFAIRRGRLFPPAERVHYFHSAIAIDVAETKPMCRSISALRYRVNSPRLRRIVTVEGCVADGAFTAEDQVGNAVAVHVAEECDLALNIRYNIELVPSTRFALWIKVQRAARRAGENVRPAIAIHVVRVLAID